MKISAIAVISSNRALGKGGALLFHVPGDLPRFKKITTGHPVIMGRKTFESKELNKKSLPNRLNIVITRDANYRAEGVVVVKSVEEAIEVAKSIPSPSSSPLKGEEVKKFPLLEGEGQGEGEIFIIGGGQIYKEAWPYIDKLYLTVVDQEAEGDTYFPDYSEFEKVVFKEEHEEEGMKYTFLEVER